ncbi:MAG: leucine-rich repeat domain-containing protein [Bacteroidales bacterium]|nr:leucine-rich repeat domain-containing protein [Bacteroidales bacterium]
MKRLALFICTLLCANVLMAQTRFWVSGLQYEVTGTNKVEVHDCSDYVTSIVIPDTVTYQEINYCVTSIGSSAFEDCRSLTSVTIPNSVTSIGDYAFSWCRSLTSVSIPNSVTSIGENAFGVCNSLTSITIPNSVTSIENSTFNNCSSLTSIDIPNSVTSIGESAFWACSTLTSITIPNSITSIADGTFGSCSNLSSIDIPNSVTSIGENAFYNCSSLTSITIPNSVTSIGDWAFSWCSLTSVTCLANIPPTIESNTFYYTSSNKTLNVNCGLREYYILYWGSDFDSNNIFEIQSYNVVANVNNSAWGNVAVESDCSTATLTATATACYQFVGWNDGNTENPRLVTLSSDTTLTANFEVMVVNNDITATICEGQVYNENGFNVSEAGTYTQSLQSVNGCDSIVTLTLNVTPSYNTNLTATICEGSELSISGFNVSEAGVYTQTHTAVNGCDSIVTLTVTALPAYNTNLTLEICEGVTMNFCGFNVTGGGVYTQSYTAVNGCDSIVTLTVTELPIIHTNLTLEICEGTSLNFSGFNVTEAGTYTQTHTAANGCDSVVTLVVSTYPTFDTTITATINAGETYAEFGFNESEAGTYVQNLQTVNGCDSTITLILNVNSSLMDVEDTELSFYPNPTNSKITFSSTIERIEVIDLTGRCVLTFSNAREINIESLPSGAYYLRLTNNDKAIMRKVIKE